jgi:hypothetical protein
MPGNLDITAFCVVMLWSYARESRFGGICSLHLQGRIGLLITFHPDVGSVNFIRNFRSPFAFHNILILYKQIIRPVWSYVIQLWCFASDSYFQVIQLKCTVNAPWYVRNSDIHRDLGIETVSDIITKFANSHEKRLQDHIDIEASRLLNVNYITRRLTLGSPFELVRS